MSFYHDKKEHMSPSALDQWLNSRAAFIRSYFASERGPTTKAMEAGTQIHSLVEAGIIKAKHVYQHAEAKLKVQVPDTDLYFLGVPDSYERHWSGSKEGEGEPDEAAYFVDYKSGKANNWAEKLPTDIKMRATAWLVWMQTGNPKKVHGFIEYIQTTWDPNTKAVVPLEGKETEVLSITYTAAELEAFTKVITREMAAVNAEYEKWLQRGDFVKAEDVDRYVALRNEIEVKEAELDEIADRIKDQMEFGGEENHKTPAGTFFIQEKSTYDYPQDLRFLVDGADEYTLEDADRVGAGLKAAKKNWELGNEPVSTNRTISFRAAKS